MYSFSGIYITNVEIGASSEDMAALCWPASSTEAEDVLGSKTGTFRASAEPRVSTDGRVEVAEKDCGAAMAAEEVGGGAYEDTEPGPEPGGGWCCGVLKVAWRGEGKSATSRRRK